MMPIKIWNLLAAFRVILLIINMYEKPYYAGLKLIILINEEVSYEK
jgi:hypothetical protein